MPNIRQLFQSNIAKTNTTPLSIEISSSEGIYMFGPDGNRYWDMISGICVSSLGHREPGIIAAIRDQCDAYLHTMVYGEFILSPQAQLAGALAESLPEHMNCVYFTNSGSEAVEGALKTARRYTGRTEIIACSNAYHGSTMGSMSLMSDDYFTRAFRPLIPDIRHIGFNNIADLDRITDNTACVILETVQAESGVKIPQDKYLTHLKRKCDESGALLILDEIQVGMGRTGKLWAFENYNIMPDILLTAKALGGGMPLGAFISTKSIMASITKNPILGHITTFGGHPVSCAAGLASFHILTSGSLIHQVASKRDLFLKLLRHPLIIEKRHAGLLIALEFEFSEIAQEIIHRALKYERLLLDFFLFNGKSIRIAPPLTISKAQIYEACLKFLRVLDSNNS
ncbi:MAG: aminotransferase class III-fold pyridoxal phosphate-dependent enzyme [Bacteroidia bacterium]|nr:aminotransferase class III-fold pyridoxal phosphate-dependent enzyme [Bacteroidia bacterium]